jgi:hypothetical protein
MNVYGAPWVRPKSEVAAPQAFIRMAQRMVFHAYGAASLALWLNPVRPCGQSREREGDGPRIFSSYPF